MQRALLLKHFLHDLSRSELEAFFRSRGVSPHQARLAFQAIHRHGVLDAARMPGISATCCKLLNSLGNSPTLRVADERCATDGTRKLRVKTPHGDSVETVIIPAGGRVTLCVSCQVGCAARCAFCHTGTMSLCRNLAAWEIVEQVRLAKARCGRVTNVVFMGMGEPLHNEDNVVRACRILNDDIGLGLSRRHLVMSTAGAGDRIRPFWEANVASLAISLHATTDAVRDRLMPLNRKWNVAALRRILLDIPWRPRESVTVAYLLLDGVNDSRDDARRLADWCAGLPAKINLLEFNAFPGSVYRRAGAEKLSAFRQWLHDYGAFNTLRHSRGSDVMAACGQLATRTDAVRK